MNWTSKGEWNLLLYLISPVSSTKKVFSLLEAYYFMNDFYCFTMDDWEWRVMDRPSDEWAKHLDSQAGSQARWVQVLINVHIYVDSNIFSQSRVQVDFYIFFFIIIFSLNITHSYISRNHFMIITLLHSTTIISIHPP